MADHTVRRAEALEILTKSERLTRKAGSFLGQVVADATPLSPAKNEWFLTLAQRAGVNVEGANDA